MLSPGNSLAISQACNQVTGCPFIAAPGSKGRAFVSKSSSSTLILWIRRSRTALQVEGYSSYCIRQGNHGSGGIIG